MEKITEIMYAVIDGRSFVALYSNRDDAEYMAEEHQKVERVRAEITRIKS